MIRYNSLNIAAGQGGAGREKTPCGTDYYTKCEKDARVFVAQRCRAEEEPLLFCVYGGDGTVNEVVGGILDANAADRASIAIAPVGTGNDFYRMLYGALAEKNGELFADVITCNDSYAVNMINIGFDCNVVEKTTILKKLPGISGSLAYMLGVGNVLLHKLCRTLKIRYLNKAGIEQVYEGETLLCAIANAPYCGGGFCAAPAAKCDDGLIDLMIIRRVSRARFLSLVKGYRDGLHVGVNDCTVAKRFADVIEYHRCSYIEIEGMEKICTDGEVFPCTHAEIGILPRAVRFVRADA